MKAIKSISVVAILLVSFSLAGCSGFQKAQAVYNVINGIVAVAEADLPSLQATGVFSATEGSVADGYLQIVRSLNGQYGSCITNAQNTKLATNGKFLACLNIFSAGLADPKELAALRVMNPKAQKQTQLWITAFQLGVNSVVAAMGGQQSPAPVVAASPTTAELHAFEARVMRGL